MEIVSRDCKFEAPPAQFEPRIIWKIGQDPQSEQVAKQLEFNPPNTDFENILRAVRREPAGLELLTGLMGRTALINAEPMDLSGIPINSIEIGGFGYQKFETVKDGLGYVDTDAPIALPSSTNFVDLVPEASQTTVVGKDGKDLMISDPYSFAGAYTRSQAAFKVAANIEIYNYLLSQKLPLFLMPVPIAIGVYPDILAPDSTPAHFIGWRVPFKGHRSGYLGLPDRMQEAESEDARRYFFIHCINDMPKVAMVARVMHDLGITHNQMGPQNYYVNPEGLLYIADFSTVRPIPRKWENSARTHELNMIFHGIQTAMNTVLNASEADMGRVPAFDRMVRTYFGANRGHELKAGEDYLPYLHKEVKELLRRQPADPKHVGKLWPRIVGYRDSLGNLLKNS